MPSSFQRLAEHVRDFGLHGLHLRVLAGLSVYREMPIFEFDFEKELQVPTSRIPVQISMVQVEELEDYFASGAEDPGEAREHAKEPGAACFVARAEGRIAARLWATDRDYRLSYLDRDLVLGQDGIYVFAVYTVPECRGAGIFGALLGTVMEHYRAQGRKRALSIIFRYNQASIRAFSKFGFRRRSVWGFYQWGPWRRYFQRPLS
ncbi:GNAT family N-acetyltransferase [Bryobacter aggregatus]|uniref:GNAT family N-acetyltransferase n=1 Tax=Bryobacter aggregatus TaxID=360054 RepID=UPI0004E19460|nr:GNAT family N-acetyltransferase [Bryobacter aggregatus]